ncbi:MAG: helix-turn-helix domain-containing protein [Candidatus Andersenbacteria bacterium]
MVESKDTKDRTQEAAELVRQARERQGISLVTAADSLHVSVEHLEAIERGDFSVFSAEVYARGAYTQYAVYLGIDSKTAQRTVLRALSSQRVITPLKMHTPERWYERIQNPRLVFIASGAFVALIVGGYIVWQLRLFWQLPALQVTAPLHHVVDNDRVVVRGASERGVKLSLNGEPFLIQEDDTFELEIELHPGINIVRLEAENAAGRKRVLEEHYLRPREKGYL